MEHLDLAIRGSEEYEGKSIVWNACEYVVGAYLGSGVERITHKLINHKSGLCWHVLKVWRRSSLGHVPSQVRAALAAVAATEINFAKIIPVSIEIDVPGGRAEIQIYAGGESPEQKSPADAFTATGDSLLRTQMAEAIHAYEEALARNPYHTHALINLAAARADMNDLRGAYSAAAKARSVARIIPCTIARAFSTWHLRDLRGLRWKSFMAPGRTFLTSTTSMTAMVTLVPHTMPESTEP